MKTFLMIVCLLGAVSLIGCTTTQANTTTPAHTKKADVKQTQKSGTYLKTFV